MIKRVIAYFNFGKRLLWWLIHFWRFKKLGKLSYFDNPIRITSSYMSCGKNVYAYKYCRFEGIASYNKKKFTPKIIFEDNVSFQQNLHLTCANSIFIGKNTAIAANVTITDIHHPYENLEIPIELQDIHVSSVYIGEDCKIYNNAVILPGTIIGKHCTIGANSVVCGVYPDYCVIAGAPSRIVKQYDFELSKWIKMESNKLK
ncbi:MAG: acyltransferase [Bacteroidetes bacterium]|nr:acyltransferase [Bacteroidota bacterium]